MAKKRRSIDFNDTQEKMVAELMSEFGYPTFSSVVFQGIIEMHRKAFPAYRTSTAGVDNRSDLRKSKDEERKEAAKDEKLAICEALGGQIVVDEKTGDQSCRYYTYSRKNRYQQTVSMNLLDHNLVRNQYDPSKEKVLKLQEEGKTNY